MNDLTISDLALRLILALVTGLVLGFEREQHGRAAGMRTTMLVCVASAVVMMLSQHLFWEASQGGATWRPDPARLAAGVLAGMGFLGAGVIIRQDNAIYGVTTAAVLWFSAILGMAFGAGYVSLGLAGFVVVLIALFVLPKVEMRIRSDRFSHFEVSAGLGGPTPAAIKQAVEALGLGGKLKLASLHQDAQRRQRVMVFDIKIKNHEMHLAQEAFVSLAAGMKGVKQVRWY